MMTDEDELIRLLDLISRIDEIEMVPWALMEKVGANPSAVTRSLIAAFLLDVSDRDDSNKLTKPKWVNQMDGQPFDQATVDWDILLSATQHERASRFVHGRIGHLIWDYKPSKSNLVIAGNAISALLQLAADTSIHSLARITFASEAAWLARTLKRDQSTQEALDQFMTIADLAIAAASTPNSQPGVLMKAVEYFLAFQGEKEVAATRLQLGILAYSSYGHIRTDIVQMLISISSPEEKAAIAGIEVDHILSDASEEDGLRREHYARQALDLARKFGLKEAQGKAAAVLGAIKPHDYGLTTVESSIPLPPEEIARFKQLREDLATKDIDWAWELWSELFPPLIPHGERLEPIMGAVDAIVTHATISEQGHVVSSSVTPEQKITRRHYENDRRHYEYLYQFAIGPGLQTLLGRPESLGKINSQVAQSSLFSNKGKARILKAFASFKDCDWDSVADTIPTIEAAIRKLAFTLGISPYSPAGDANQFKTLGGLIGDVTPHLPDSRDGRFWAFALTEGFGYNFRNDYLHGINEEPTQFDATLVLQIFAQLLRLSFDAEPSVP